MKFENKWLGYKDSNLGMVGPKPTALPLGDTPIKSEIISLLFLFVNILNIFLISL